MRVLPALLLTLPVACGRAAAPAAAPASPTPLVRPLPDGALAPGTYVTTAVRRTFRLVVAADAAGVWAAGAETANGFTLRAGPAAMGVVAFAPGATTRDALLRALRSTPGLAKAADEVTKPVSGYGAWHLTWRVTKPVRLRLGGLPFTFATGERNHAIVVSAPRAPVLVLMSARADTDYDTVYREGHRVVFATEIGP